MTTTYTPQPASDKQLKFINKLIVERSEALDVLGVTITEVQLLQLSTKGASATIDKLMALPTNSTHPSHAPATKPEALVPGFYMLEGQVYKVKPSQKSDRMYASVLVDAPAGHKATFAYAKGVVYKLTLADRMTPEQAKAYGDLYGRCCCCGKLLTVDLSIERGVGPVCWDKYFG